MGILGVAAGEPIIRPVTKPDSLRELTRVDVARLRSTLRRTSETVWNLENSRKENNFPVFDQTRHIIFRFIEGNRDRTCFYSMPIWDVWKDLLVPVLEKAAAPYGFHDPVYPKVMLARLAAGGTINRHTDGAGSNLFTHKIHVPIETNDQARILINDQVFHLETGRAYELNNIAPHGSENPGATDRIHLIFEVYESNDPGEAECRGTQ